MYIDYLRVDFFIKNTTFIQFEGYVVSFMRHAMLVTKLILKMTYSFYMQNVYPISYQTYH